MAVGGKVKFEVDDWTSIRQREKCGMCNKTEHDGYCSQCEIYVCQICFVNHLNSKFCRDHVLLQNADKSNSQDSGVRFDTCSEHEHQEVRLYCTDHKCCGCAKCILVRHSLCKWEYIVEASNRFQDSGDLARLLEDVQGLEYTLDKYMEAIDKHSLSAETIDKDVVSDIETFAKSLIEYVAGSKQQALDDAKVRESAHQQTLDKLKVDIQSLGSQVEEIITDFRDEDMLHKRFILAVETLPIVARIQNEIAAIDCNNVITNYTFRPGNFHKRMMSNTRPLGKLTDASQIEEDEEDDEDFKLKKERERSQGLEQQLEENQIMMSKLKKDVHDMEQTYGNVVSKLNKDLGDVNQNSDTLTKEKQTIENELYALRTTHETITNEKQSIEKELYALWTTHESLEQQICFQEFSNQNVVSKLNKDIGDLKKNYDTIVKDKQSIEQELLTLKHTHQVSGKTVSINVNLSCGHENLVGQFDENKLMACCTCGIIYGDQSNGTFTTNNKDTYTKLTFNFPKGTQSKLNRNPGLPYSGKTVTCYLKNDAEGTVLLKMMNIAFQRKCLFTVDNHGNIKNGVELFTQVLPSVRDGFFESMYREYIARVRQQLDGRGIKESDVAQL